MLTSCSAPFFAPATPTPTPSPTNTATPTATPVPTSTPTFTPSPVPNGPCDNPLVPLGIGNEWEYSATTTGGKTPYVLKALERRDTTRVIITVVELSNLKSGEVVQENVVCRDGVIENFPLYVADMLFGEYLKKFFNTYHAKGDYAPAYASFMETNWILAWQTNYLTEDAAFIKNPNGDTNLTVLQSSTIDMYFDTDGKRESITVPAGTFPQALKVRHSFLMTVTLLSPSGAFGGTLKMDTTQWYEPYVGLLRSEVNSAEVNFNMQKIRAPFPSVLELTKFTPGE